MGSSCSYFVFYFAGKSPDSTIPETDLDDSDEEGKLCLLFVNINLMKSDKYNGSLGVIGSLA